MMKKQCVVVEPNVYELKRILDMYLEEGWLVVHLADGIAVIERKDE